MQEQEAKKLLVEAEKLRAARARWEIEREQALGAVKNVVAELKSEYGVSSLEEARLLLSSMSSSLEDSVRELRDKLKEIDGEEDSSRKA